MNSSKAKIKPSFTSIVFIISFFLASCNILAQVGIHQIGESILAKSLRHDAGWAVSMPDSITIAVSAPLASGIFAQKPGQVRVFKWNGIAWIQKGQDIEGTGSLKSLGYVVDMPDSNTLAVGIPLNKDSLGLTQAGRVKVFRWDGNTWIQKGGDLDGGLAGDAFGSSLSMPDSNTIAIGAPHRDGSNGIDAIGQVKVYRWNGSNWVQKGTEINGFQFYELSGVAVSMADSNTMAIGSNHFDGIGVNSGRVKVFHWNGQAWTQKGTDINGKAAGDRFGESITMVNTNLLAVGAPYNSDSATNCGQVRVFRWTGSNWLQEGNDINGLGAGDGFGTSLSMPNSEIISIGAPRTDASDSLLGYTAIYRWNNGVWNSNGSVIWGDTIKDLTGKSVSMPTKNTLAVGIPKHHIPLDSGEVKVYYICGEDEPEVVNADCGIDSLLVKFTDAVKCGDFSGNEFRLISKTSGVSLPIIGIDTGYCKHGLTYQIQLKLHQAITYNDSFTLQIKKGNDGNTFSTICDQWIPENNFIDFSITNCSGGIGQLETEYIQGIELYPTVSQSEIKLKFSDQYNQKPSELSIINSQGQVLRSWRSSVGRDHEETISVAALPPGIYTLVIQSGEQMLSKAFIRE